MEPHEPEQRQVAQPVCIKGGSTGQKGGTLSLLTYEISPCPDEEALNLTKNLMTCASPSLLYYSRA